MRNSNSDRRIRSLACALCVLSLFTCHLAAAPSDFLLVHRSGRVESIKLVEVTAANVQFAREDENWTTVDLNGCVALLNPNVTMRNRPRGLLTLSNGQRLPGEAIANAKPRSDAIAWSHPWLGRVEVPLDSIDSIAFLPNVLPPPPGRADVVLLANGDQQEGLITALGNPISIDLERADAPPQKVDIPLQLVAALTLVTPRQQPLGKRVWFSEGTVLDVESFVVGADGLVRIAGAAVTAAAAQQAGGQNHPRMTIADIAAVQFDPLGMQPLAQLNPSRVEGPATRYVIPKPRPLDGDAPLALAGIEFQGPLTVRYALPAGWQRLYAEAELPGYAQAWGDLELVIRSDDQEVFRATLNSKNPSALINVALPGRELTIALLPGAYGPIQDVVVLQRAMLLKER